MLIKKPSKQEIIDFITDDEMYDLVSDDKSPPKQTFDFDILFKMMKCRFVGAYVDNELAALAIVYNLRLHFMVLKRHRLKARELYRAIEQKLPSNVYVRVPVKYKTLINFAKKNGFVGTKLIKNSFPKGGYFYDEIIMKRGKRCQ